MQYMQKALSAELENKKILGLVPAGQTLSAVESSASLKFTFGIDSPIADLDLSDSASSFEIQPLKISRKFLSLFKNKNLCKAC